MVDTQACDGLDVYGRPCAYPAKPKGRFCSDACRARTWRVRKIPRCPHCGTPLELDVRRSNSPESSCA